MCDRFCEERRRRSREYARLEAMTEREPVGVLNHGQHGPYQAKVRTRWESSVSAPWLFAATRSSLLNACGVVPPRPEGR